VRRQCDACGNAEADRAKEVEEQVQQACRSRSRLAGPTNTIIALAGQDGWSERQDNNRTGGPVT
jgi:hypothetical protein